MNHVAWIQQQFAAKRTMACYRDVLIHTSFVETIVKTEALLALAKPRQPQTKKKGKTQQKKRGGIDFAHAIGILRRKGHAMTKIDQLREKRNKIIHELLRNVGLDDMLVTRTIKEMRDLLEHIYHNSAFVQTYCQKEYQVDTKRF